MGKSNESILLINPPPPEGAFVHYHNPPLGLAYISAILEDKYDVKILDCPASNIGYGNLKEKILQIKPKIAGLTAATVVFPSALRVAKIVKEVYPDCVTVLGGPHATLMDKDIIRENPEIDVIVRGEGEVTFLELTKVILDVEGNLKDVAGITFRNEGCVIRTNDRPYIMNLDQLPYPSFQHFPLKKYRRFGYLILPVLSSRGCPFNCAFCSAPKIAGRQVRMRNPQKVVDELEYMKKAFSPDAFTFHDETFTYNSERVYELCNEIIRRKLHVPWDCSTRVDCVSREILIKMAEANCQLISFGIESGSQEMLNIMRKGTTVRQGEKAIKYAKDAGLCVSISLIIGYPGETVESMAQTFDFIRRTEPDSVELSIATPYPGTELYDIVKEMGYKVEWDWERFDMQTSVIHEPFIGKINLKKIRQKFYNEFYTPNYIVRHWVKGTFYSRLLARVAVNHILNRIKKIIILGL